MSLRRAAAAVVLFAAATAAHAQFVINEGFNNVATLAGSGWVLANASVPLGSTPGWFQGDQTIFTSQAGAPQAYIAANFNNAAAGGTLATWLISPTFSTQDGGVVSFYARADIVPEFSDKLKWGFSNGGSSFADFAFIGPDHTIGGDWTQFQINFGAQGAGSIGRFAIVYTGPADSANYVGVDTFTVAVPEPETWALMLAGLAGLGVLKRRRAVRR
jgi:hypothetical protein